MKKSMKKSHSISRCTKKVFTFLLAFVICISITGMSFAGMATKAYADTENDTAASSSMISKVDTNQVSQASTLGFPTGRQERKDEYGNTVDANVNPLGTNTTYLNRVLQLAIIGKNTDNAIYNFPLAVGGIDKSKKLMYTQSGISGIMKTLLYSAIQSAPKASVAADINGIADPGSKDDTRGNGTQVIVTAAIPFSSDNDKQHVSLMLMINDYNGGKPVTSIFDVVNNIPTPPCINGDYMTSTKDYQIDVAAGDFDHDGRDEIAVMIGSRLYIIKIKKNGNSYDLDKVNSNNFYGVSPQGGKDRSRNEVDIEAGDADGDGYKDLLVSFGNTTKQTGNPARLYIYTNMKDLNPDTSNVSANIALKPQNNDAYAFTSASMDVGDPFGTGKKVIVIGGRLANNKLAITYLAYNGKDKRFDDMSNSSHPIYTFDDSTMLKGVKNYLPGIKCVLLDGSGTLPYVVFGNVITQYNSGKNAFDIINLSEPVKPVDPKNPKKTPEPIDKYQDSKLSYQNQHKSGHYGGDITDIWKSTSDYVDDSSGKSKKTDGGDSTYILQTLVGNFDGNPEGREQVVMLHYNIFYDDGYVFVTWVGKSSKDAPVYNNLRQLWKGGTGDNTNYPTIAAPDVLDNGETLIAEPGKSTFTYSNPSVIAVIAAPPYYSELQDKYSSVLGNSSTTFGTGHESGSSSSNGVSASVGVSFGYSQDISVFGFHLGEIDFETDITNSFTAGFSSSKSISTSTTYTNAIGSAPDDSVVMTAVPYDVYYYKAFSSNKKVVEVVVEVPYAPVTTTKTLTAYNKLTKDMPYAPKITGDVLKNHVVGDPRTYAVSDNDINHLSNVKNKKPLFMDKTYDKSFATTGDDGDFYTTQQIESTKEKEQSFDYELNVDVSSSIELLGYKTGASVGAGYSNGQSSSEADSVTVSGTVANVPSGYSQYGFRWCMATYNYNLTSNDGKKTSECSVVNYITRPERGSFPIEQPKNLHMVDGSQKSDTADIAWDSVKHASSYKIYESNSGDNGEYTVIGNAQGSLVKPEFTVKGLSKTSSDKLCFKVSALDSSGMEGVPSDNIEIDSVKAKGISIKTKPELNYTEGDKLDLSGLVVTIDYNNNQSQDIAYKDSRNFTDNNLKVSVSSGSISDGMVLDTSNSGNAVTVTYDNGNTQYTADAGNISVAAKSSDDITIGVNFKYNLYKNYYLPASRLYANQMLYADAAITNNIGMPQDVLVIFALYDNNGSMVNMTSLGQNLSANGKKPFSLKMQLPANINGYKAKVFVWDGTSISTTKQIPKANVVEIE